LLTLLDDKEFATKDILRWVVIHMPRDDAPEPLKITAEASAKNNAKED
jgi:pyruvate decarboxylase